MHGLPGRLFTTLQVSPRTANLHKTILILARSDHPIDPNATIRPTPVAISERFPYPFPTVHAKSSRKEVTEVTVCPGDDKPKTKCHNPCHIAAIQSHNSIRHGPSRRPGCSSRQILMSEVEENDAMLCRYGHALA